MRSRIAIVACMIIIQSSVSMALLMPYYQSIGRLLRQSRRSSVSMLQYGAALDCISSQRLHTTSIFNDNLNLLCRSFVSKSKSSLKPSTERDTAREAVTGSYDSSVNAKHVHHVFTTPLKAMCKFYQPI